MNTNPNRPSDAVSAVSGGSAPAAAARQQFSRAEGFGKRMLCAWVEFAAYMPVLYAAGYLLLTAQYSLLFLGMMIAAQFLGAICALLFVRQPFVTYVMGIFITVGAFSLIFLLPGLPEGSLAMLCACGAAGLIFVCYIRGKRTLYTPWFDAVSPPEYLGLLLVYGLAFAVIGVTNLFGDYTYFLGGLIIVMAVTAFLSMNRSATLSQVNRGTKLKLKTHFFETMDETSVTRAKEAVNVVGLGRRMKRQNNRWIAIALMISVVLIPAVALSFGSAGNAIVSSMNSREEYVPLDLQPTEYDDPDVVKDDSADDTSVDDGAANVFLVTFAIVAGGIFIVVMLYILSRNVRDWINEALIMKSDKAVKQRRSRKKKNLDDDESKIYTEQVETVAAEAADRRYRAERGFDNLPDEQSRARFLYRAMLRKAHSKGAKLFRWKTPYETAAQLASSEPVERQILMRDVALNYNSARYGGTAPADGTSARIKGELHL